MSEKLIAPDFRRSLADLGRRLSILERRITDAGRAAAGPGFTNEIIFSHAGPLAVTWSPPAYLRAASALVEIVCSLGTPGSTTTTVEVKKDATTVATLTIPGGQFFAQATAYVRYAKDYDQLIVAISAVGTGAEDLTVQARFR